MAKNVVINNVVYQSVPQVSIPLSGSTGTADFYDTSDATLDSGGKMLVGNTAYANGVKYAGSIETKKQSDLTAVGASVTVPAGYYASQVSKEVASGEATAPASISGTSASVSAGTNTLTLSKTVSVTPVVTEGYVGSGTAGNSVISLTASVATRGEGTITPGTSDQSIASGTYLAGSQTIKGDSNLQAQNIKSGVSIFGVNGSLSAATVSQDGTTKVLTVS